MGSFLFQWTHPASEVFVTGTFDDWSKSAKLERVGPDVFEKNVALGDAHASKKIYYKFVVDGNWTTDHTAPQENDENGNLNNFLTPDRITKPSIMSGVTPQSTTAELAKDVPLEQTGSSDLPGAFPETPLETPGMRKDLSVNPIPASEGLGNPIQLGPGEKVPAPSEINSNTINSTVKLDQESYENGPSAPVLPNVVTPENERAENGTGVLDLPPISGTMIPESSLPMGTSGIGTYDASPLIQSAAPQSSTALLAAAVPLESSKVPAHVAESQEEAGFAPEASAVPEEVQEKSEVEQELLKEVPEAPSTSEGTAGKGTDKSEDPIPSPAEISVGAGGSIVAASSATVAAIYAAEDNAAHAITGPSAAAESAPEVVKDSIAAAGAAPEAAAYTAPIADKAAVEQELLSAVMPAETVADKAAVQKELLATVAPAPADPAPHIIEPAPVVAAAAETAGSDIPAGSRDVSPSTVPGARTPTAPEVTTGVEAATVPAVSAAAPSTEAPAAAAAAVGGGGAVVPETPVASSRAEAADPGSGSVGDKKKKRRSFFGSLKEKFSGHKKEKSSS